jgi:cystinosin
MSRLDRGFADRRFPVIAGIAILFVGVLLGLTMDANQEVPAPWNRVSSVLGWLYFVCWAAAPYPQVWLNHSRKSTIGFSLDYAVLAILGFACYAVFNCAFFFSESVQQAYMRRHGGKRNAVEFNDVVFAVHATFIHGVAIAQCLAYPQAKRVGSRMTDASTVATVVSIAAFALAIAATGNQDDGFFTVLNLMYYLSYVKLASTLVKNTPQVLLNFQRRSTAGFTIWAVLLDVPGSVFSLAQLALDSWAMEDWNAMLGDPVKLWLAVVSLLIDAVYCVQHYVLYPESDDSDSKRLSEESETLPLVVGKTSVVLPSYSAPHPSSWLSRANVSSEHAVDGASWDAAGESHRV